MKKIIFALALCALPLSFLQPTAATSAASQQTYFAQITDTDVLFYQSTSEESAIFNLPYSFFVQLYGKEGDFYKAKFIDLDGYVKVGSVVPIKEVPEIKYPENAVITVNTSLGVKLLPSPHFDSDDNAPILASGESAITYYGTIGGDRVNDNPSEWIYCKYQNEFGYIYAADCKVAITRVAERYTPLDEVIFEVAEPSKGLSTVAKVFIILGVSLPCALLIFLLIKPSLSGQVIKTKVKSKKRRHGDYFEFDENDLG